MHKVTVDGVDYFPKSEDNTPKIGIAVATYNRQKVLDNTLENIIKHTPDAYIVVVDDASTTPVTVPDGVDIIRQKTNGGIAKTKNRCLEALDDAGVEHFFLFDDDAWPIVDGWWKPYVDSPEPHLMAIFDKPKGTTKTQVEVVYEDDNHVAYHATRGYMLYVHREAVERVGGMDPDFGAWGWEHQSWSDRIHAAGLTTWRYADVKGSGDLIYSMDQAGEIKSTATDASRRFSAGPGLELRMQSRHSDRYIEYRELEDVVLTALLTQGPDPQRGTKMSSSESMVKALHDSLSFTGRFVLAHTDMAHEGKLPYAEKWKVTQYGNPYFDRWVHYYQWLRDNPKTRFVWCVDATDVEMTRNPFPEMEEGTLYMGYEPTTLRDEWMNDHHPDETLQKFMKDNANLPLLNMGVVGGDRETVMEFSQRVIKFYFDDYIDFIYGWETKRAFDKISGDMATGNYIARTFFDGRISSGPHITNVFKSGKKSDVAWFAHK